MNLIPILAATLCLLAAAHAEIFYLDSIHGDDTHSGRSADQAWKSLAKANANPFQPGDTLELKRGSRFQGGLSLSLHGAPGKPVVIVKDQGIEIPKLAQDDIGLKIGLKITRDFFGNPIIGKPDIGAIEIN